MNVLSLFDGMSCGQIALKQMGVTVDNYYAAEIDKHAIQVAKHNFSKMVHLGDVTKWQEWDINWSKIDLLLGGSPCQGFSFAGKQLAFDDPRSALFFVFVDIWQHIQKHNPSAYFLLENVRMKQEHEAVITSYMKVHPITINSALVSAQNRVRLYWTNIANEPYGFFGDMRCTIDQPEDQGILLRDVLEEEVDDKYYLSEKMVNGFIRHTEKHQAKGNGFKFEPTTGNCKGASVTTRAGSRPDDNYIVAQDNSQAVEYTQRIRRLTPLECQRLQTVPEWYDMTVVSDTQRYRCLGNGWTVNVIVWILSHARF